MKDYTFKVANMRTPQEFTLYPYTGGDMIILQSDKRITRVNLRTGEGTINGSNVKNSCFAHLQINPVKFTLPEDIKKEIQKHLWQNDGKDGNLSGVVTFENKQLFSKPEQKKVKLIFEAEYWNFYSLDNKLIFGCTEYQDAEGHASAKGWDITETIMED